MDPGGVPVQTAAVTPPRAQYGNYTASLRPAAQNVPVTYQAGGDRGLFGAQMSPGMASILNTDPRYAAQRSGAVPARSAVPITVRGGNKTQQALAQVAQATAPRVAPQPTVAATQFQQDRFQTTEGAQLPSSMGSTRWTTGY
jgi:hypothetical protein